MKIEKTILSVSESIKFSVKIKNIGEKAGKEVVQVYINDKISSVATPVMQLKEFKKIELNPSESKIVEFEIPCSELGLWDRKMKYIVEPGEFEIMVGSSSKDIRMNQIVVIK